MKPVNRILDFLFGAQIIRTGKLARLKHAAATSTQEQSPHDLRELILSFQNEQLQATHPNPLNRFGQKCFSQSDEDGITMEILSRLAILENGVFAEFGVGNGMENNTLILGALGWKGFWVGSEELAFNLGKESARLHFYRQWVTRENIVALTHHAMKELEADSLDVISLDLDGNDIHLCEALLTAGLKPKLFIVEYNAKFPPPIRFQIDYDPEHVWKDDDYFGASLASLAELFLDHGMRLVCCNSHTGANAFFVRDTYLDRFADVPKDIARIYVGPRYHLQRNHGHKPSTKTITSLLRRA